MTNPLRAICVAIALLFAGAAPAPALATFDAIFVDVGQGECTIIQCDGETMVIDAGGKSDVCKKNIPKALEALDASSINIIVATHPDRDHNSYLEKLILHYGADADMLLLPPIEDRTSNTYYQRVIEAANRVHLQKVYPFVGDSFSLGSAIITVYGPHPVAYSLDDNWSLVLMVEYDRQRFLFTGDIEAKAERDMLTYYDKLTLKADVLKVAKHGSDSSSSWDFLCAVQPRIAIISCSKNNQYGFPHGDTISNLLDCGVEDILTTYKEGSIHLRVADGEIVVVK